MKKLNLQQMEVVEGGKFWGSETEFDVVLDPSCASGYRVLLFDNYYVLGIRTKHEQVGDAGCLT